MRTPGPTRPRRILGYARVSSQEQAIGSSLTDQQNAIAREAQSRGLKVDRYFVEAESAVHEKFERREQMQSLMGDLRSGDLVLCDKLDRWSRDPEFSYRSIRLIREAGAQVYFVGEQLDPSTPEGDSLLSFRVAFAREEHKRIKIRTWGTRQLLRDQGLYAEGLPPLGYKRQLPRGAKGRIKNVLLADPKESAIVLDVFRRCIRGQSIGSIVEHLKATQDARKWDKKQIGHLLRNRVYLGEVKDSRKVWIKGQHAPLVDATTFDKANRALSGRRLGGATPRADSRTNQWLLRAIGTCGRCGSKLSAAYGGGFGRNSAYVDYYRCPKRCGARLVRVKEVDPIVDAMALRRLVEIRSHLAGSKPAAPESVPEPAIDFPARREAIGRKQERIVQAFTDGVMAREKMHAEIAKLDAARTRLDAEETKQFRRPAVEDVRVRRSMLNEVTRLQKWWSGGPIAAKRKALALLAHSVKLEKEKPPLVAWRTIDEMAEEVRH